MIHSVYTIIWTIFKFIIALILAYFVLKSFSVLFKNRGKGSFKRKLKHKLWHIRNNRFIKPVEFLKWVIIDIMRGKDRLRLFGIWAFTGYYGEGKTMGCVQFAKHLQKQYPHRNIKIFSNIDVVGQEKKIQDWKELLDLPKNSIFIYDESQSDWSCNIGVNSFPEDFLRRITQVRKKQFAMFMTSPRYNRMNINIRESISFVIECKNLFSLDRWFSYNFYRAEDYEQYYDNKLKLKLHRYFKISIVAQDKDYRQYDTTQEVESIKSDDKEIKKNEVIMISDYFKKFRNEILKELDNKLKKIEK